MKRWFQYSLIAMFVILIVEVILVAPDRLDNGDELVSLGKGDRGLASQHMEEVHLVETTNGQKEWDLRARTALSFKGSEDWKISEVTVTFYGDDGLSILVTGDEGIVRSESKNVEITGKVRVLASNGYQYFSDRVIYASEPRTLTSAKEVRIVGPRKLGQDSLRLKGGSMVMKIASGDIHLGSPVAGEILVSAGKKSSIKSQEAEFSARTYHARFMGTVRIVYGTLTVKGPEAVFNYTKETKILDSIDLRGGVKVTDVDKWASAKQLHIVTAKDRFIFRGAPRLVQDNDELRGDEIIFSDGGAQVRVVNGRAKINEGETEGIH